jgi:DNA-binding response OmpR family regulator
LANLLVVMLANLNSEDHELYRLNSGADDYIAKPFSPAILSARVKRLLSARQAQQMLYQPKIDSENQIGNFLTQDISNQAIHFKSRSIIKLHDYEFNILEQIVTLKSGEKRVLTDRAFNLAFLLFNHLGTSFNNPVNLNAVLYQIKTTLKML